MNIVFRLWELLLSCSTTPVLIVDAEVLLLHCYCYWYCCCYYIRIYCIAVVYPVAVVQLFWRFTLFVY